MRAAGTVIAAALLALGCHPNRGGETVPCPAGEPIWIGCNSSCGLGSCWGDPAIRVCDGEVAVPSCTEDRAIAIADDSVGICPSACPVARTRCPASGRVTVTVQRGRGDYACDWALAPRGLLDGDLLDAAVEGGRDGAFEDASGAPEDAAPDASLEDAAPDAPPEDASGAPEDAASDAPLEDAGAEES